MTTLVLVWLLFGVVFLWIGEWRHRLLVQHDAEERVKQERARATIALEWADNDLTRTEARHSAELARLHDSYERALRLATTGRPDVPRASQAVREEGDETLVAKATRDELGKAADEGAKRLMQEYANLGTPVSYEEALVEAQSILASVGVRPNPERHLMVRD